MKKEKSSENNKLEILTFPGDKCDPHPDHKVAFKQQWKLANTHELFQIIKACYNVVFDGLQ